MPDRMVRMVRAPWTTEQVLTLNLFQASGCFHPFTCGNRGLFLHKGDGVLIARADGWRCPELGCGYLQTWAHDFMADPSWVAEMIRWHEELFRSMSE